jgi:hypothetical protein
MAQALRVRREASTAEDAVHQPVLTKTLGNLDRQVESAWGAGPALLPVCFPRPLAEPGVCLSTHPALDGQLLGTVGCR